MAENINTFTPPPKKSKPAETPKPQPKPQPNVNNKADAERVLSDFTTAFLNRDRAGMESCSFYEPRNFSKEKVYEMLDAQIVFIFGSDTMSCSNIRVCNVGGSWLVDANSFALSTRLNFTRAIYSGY